MKQTYLRGLLIGGSFFLVDQYLKFVARTNQSLDWYIVEPWLGWEYYANPGIAFSIPVPNALLILVTPLILIGLLVFWEKKKRPARLTMALLLIVAGAISNLIDRILFDATIDYLRLGTSVINLADVAILWGAVLVLFPEKRKPS